MRQRVSDFINKYPSVLNALLAEAASGRPALGGIEGDLLAEFPGSFEKSNPDWYANRQQAGLGICDVLRNHDFEPAGEVPYAAGVVFANANWYQRVKPAK